MKKVFFALLATCAFLYSEAQNTAGIYLNAADYLDGKLSFTAPVHGKYRIRLNDLLASPHITVINGDRREVYAKDSIFGYRNSDSTAFRLFGRDSYEVMNGTALPMLYKQIIIHGGKGAHTEVSYYFSRDASAPVLLLTRRNLRNAYSADPAFLERMDDSFNSDADLSQYEGYRSVYKLNRIYQTSHTANR